MPTKTCAVTVKATAADDPTLKDGQFTALASVFNNVDAVGDVVMPGAFADNLKAWSESGDPIPLLWGHQMQDPDMNIGHVLEASETEAGLQIKAELDLENPKAAQVYRLLKGRRVKKMSFAYDIDDGALGERDGKSVYELRKLSVHEVSVVQVPANPEAIIQQVKAAADRRKAQLKDAAVDPELTAAFAQFLDQLTAHAETTAAAAASVEPAGAAPKTGEPAAAYQPLRAAFDNLTGSFAALKAALDSLDNTSTDGKANPAPPAAVEEPHGVKTDTPALPGPASLRLRAGLDADTAEYLTD